MTQSSSPIRVLHVDDEPDFAELAADFLERQNDRMTVETAVSADKGLERLADNAFDCIISDYDMPGKNGINFLETVREGSPELPFILYTGKGSEEIASEAISSGVTDYLQKDSGIDQYALLANRVQNAVSRAQAQQRAEESQARYRTLIDDVLDTSDIGTIILDSNFEIVWLNTAIEEYYGIDRDEVIGTDKRTLIETDIADVFEQPDRFEQLVKETYDDNTYVEEFTCHVLPGENREERWLRHWSQPIESGRFEGGRIEHYTDITAQTEQQREIQRFERIAENLPVGIFRTTTEGEFVSMNDEFVSLYNADSKEELTDIEVSELYANPDEREKLLHELEREGMVKDWEVQVETLDGQSKWIETTLRFTEEDGDRFLDGIVHDITEQRERQQRLEQAQTMFENAQDALFLIDVEDRFRIERVNPAYEASTGLSENDLVGRTPREILGEDQGAQIERKYQTCVEEVSSMQYEEELSIDGESSFWETRIAPVVVEGEVRKIVGATRDITDRKEREQELRRTERRFEAMFEDPNILVGLIDTDGTVLDINETAMEYLDTELEAITGQLFWETPWFTGDKEVQAEVRDWVERAANGEYVEFEADLSEAVGDELIVSGVFRPVTNDDGQVVSLVISDRDITERKRRERDLRQYETLVETLPIGYARTSFDDEFLAVNSTFVEMLGGESKEEIRSHDVSQFYQDPTTRDQLMATLREEGVVEGKELKVTTMSGDEIWVRVTGRLVDDGPYIDALIHDITERKQEQQERERRYEAIFNQTYQFTGLMEPDGTLIEANQTALDFGGLDPGDVLGKPFWEAYWWRGDEARQRELRNAIERAANGEFVRYDVEVEGEDENVLIDFSIRPVTDDVGQVEFLIPEGRNITELKSLQERERELQEIREQIEFALDITDSIIWSVNLKTEESTDHGPVEDLFGVEPSGLSDFLTEVVHPEDRAQLEQVFDEILAGESENFEAEFRTVPEHTDSDWIASKGYVQQGTDDRPPRLIGLATDITARKQREAELKRQNERLDEFASIVSHDLRNPLRVAQGHLELASEEVDYDELEAVGSALDRMERLISDLLTLAREGDEAVELEPVSLADVVERSWGNVDTAEATFSVETDITFHADRSRIQQLMENLLRNAIEHGGSAVSIRAGKLPSEDGFYVADDGPGIPEEERSKVFESGHSTDEDGTGFGLAIVKEIVEAHDWQIDATASNTGGARFEITGIELISD